LWFFQTWFGGIYHHHAVCVRLGMRERRVFAALKGHAAHLQMPALACMPLLAVFLSAVLL
jgi:hypothetical protein